MGITRPVYRRWAPSFQGVSPGATARCEVPVGMSEHQWLLLYTGATLAQLTGIRLIVDEHVIQTFGSGTDLDLDDQYLGMPAAAGSVAIMWDRYGLKNRPAVEFTTLGTGIVTPDASGARQTPNNMRIEVDIDAAAVAPTLELRLKETEAQPAGLTLHRYQTALAAGVLGENYMQNLALNTWVNRVIFMSSLVTRVQLKLDNTTVFDRTSAENSKAQADGIRVPQAGMYVLDTTEDGNGDEGFITAGHQSVIWDIWLSAAGVVPIVLETIEPALGG